jgi:hypothetical protein
VPNNEYLDSLRERYKWYIDKIDELYISYTLPTDAFYFKLSNGKIKINIDDVESLEMAIDNIQQTLMRMEAHIEREKYKKIIKKDLHTSLLKI